MTGLAKGVAASAASGAASDPSPDPEGPNKAASYGPVWLLAVAQTINYGALYYIFPALLPTWEAAFGWSKATLAIGPTLAVLISALLAPMIGRLVDHGWGGRLLVCGPLLGAAALAGLSQVRTPQEFALVWLMIGVAQSMSFYETCFAFLTQVFGTGARSAITRVTLVAGLAVTITFPVAAVMVAHWGWRGAVLGFAAALLFVALPANLLGSRGLGSWGLGSRGLGSVEHAQRAHSAIRARAGGAGLKIALARREFWLVAAIFGLLYLNHGVVITYLLPILTDRGAGMGMAVIAAACIGPAQMAGRLVLMLSGGRITTGWTVRACILWIILAGFVLWLAGAAVWLVFVFALLQGGAMGMVSILRPVLTAEVLGRQSFGAISGAIAMAPLLAGAAAPFLGAGLIGWLGVPGLLAAAVGMGGLAFGAALVLRALEPGRAGVD